MWPGNFSAEKYSWIQVCIQDILNSGLGSPGVPEDDKWVCGLKINKFDHCLKITKLKIKNSDYILRINLVPRA